MKYEIKKTFEFQEWFSKESEKSQLQILKRFSNIELEGHFGKIKDVMDDVWELKWDHGRRIYYAYIPVSKILILLGGNKNGQSYDIAQAKKILKKYTQN